MNEHALQAQRLREIDDLLAECQRHGMPVVMVSYAQLRALRSVAAHPEAETMYSFDRTDRVIRKHTAGLDKGIYVAEVIGWDSALLGELLASKASDGQSAAKAKEGS